nr:Poly(3-hydroxybutyrate) depolymerase [Streptococcus thermophilus]
MLSAAALAACGDGNKDSMRADSIADEVTQTVREELVEPVREFEGDPFTETRKIEAGGLDRKFIVTVPPDVEERIDLPLIFAFHGYKNNAEAMRKFTQLDRAHAVVVYMDGVGDAWAPAPYAKTTGEQDLAYFDAVRQQMLDEFPIDPARVFVTGLSNGGGFAAYTACHRSHQITGIATVSAAFYDKVFEDCSPTPVKQIDMHGTKDGIIEYEGGVRHNEAYMDIEDVMANASRRNHCEPEPVRAEIRRPGEEFVWEGCDAQLRHYRLDGGGHVWPGSKQDNSYATQPYDGFGTEMILDFFGVHYSGALGPNPQ